MKVEQVAKVEPKTEPVAPVPAHVAEKEAHVLKQIEKLEEHLKLARDNKKMNPAQLKVVEENVAAQVKEHKAELAFIAAFKKDQSKEAVKFRVKTLRAELAFLKTVE